MGCICHLADLAAKSGMEVLSVDIYQCSWMYFITFTIPVKGSKNFVASGVLYLQVSLKQFLSIVLLGGLVYCFVLVSIFLNLMV